MTPETAQRGEAAALRRRLRRLNEASLHLAEGLDFGDYFSSLGLQDFRLPVETGPSLVAPILSRGEAVGSIYLSKLASQELFTGEDEETLAMFATQAALAIANARRYRDERRARTDLETLIDTAPVGVLVIDAELGDTILVNRELQRINAAVRGEHDPPRELPQELVVRRADGREDSLADNPVAELLRGGAAIRAERIVLSLPGGPAIAVLVNATPIRDADGNVASAVITVQDLTPLEELDRLRADVLGLARDELRSPLVSVKGAAATLLSSHSDLHPAECAQLAQVIDEEADRIRSLIAEMGDLARIHTGTLPLTPAPTDLVGLARDTAEAVLNSADGLPVAVDADPSILLVAADRREIARVLRSIIADALWASEGSVPVSVAVVPDGSFGKVTVAHRPAEPALRLAALLAGQSDAGTRLIGNGPGHDGAAPSDAGRSALGLAICKGIVEAHGGRIWADGGTAGETRVSFTLPLDQPVESAVAPIDGQPARRRQTAILVIDVDPLTQRYINDTLTPAGFELAFAGDVQEALVGTDAKEPDLVLAGFAHPDAASVQLMLAMGAEADTPVVFIVDRGHDEAVVSLMQAGAADYVAKPFSPTELLARVRAALHRGALAESAAPRTFSLGNLTVDYAARTVTVSGRTVALTGTEYRLLCELAANPGRTLSSDQLMRRVWKKTLDDPTGPVRSAIKRLRQKLGDDARRPAYIITEPRAGYRIIDPPKTTPTS